MKFIEDFTRDEYIDWLIACRGYSYADAVKMADRMGVLADMEVKNDRNGYH